MDWLPLLSTFGGAAIALSGTFLLETRKQREARLRDHLTERRVKYIEFVAALHHLHSNFRRCTQPSHEEIDLNQATINVIQESGVYSARESMLLTASRNVAKEAEVAFSKTMAFQPIISMGFPIKSTEYHNAYHEYAEAIWRLRMEIRSDLGIPSLLPEDLGKRSWSEREDCKYCNKSQAIHDEPQQ